MKPMTIALVQMTCGPSKKQNLEKAGQKIAEAARKGARLVCLQELHATPYFCQTEDPACFDFAEPISGPTMKFLCTAAKKTKTVLVGSLFERRSAGLYHNTAVVIEKTGKIAGIYRKMHLPDDPSYYEKYYFAPGDLGFTPIASSVGKLGVLVCWDQWYPEAARLMALNGADLLIYPTAIGWEPSDTAAEKKRQLLAWTTMQQSHAIANGLHVVSINRVGLEKSPEHATKTNKGIVFWGNSFIAGPQGEILARASDTKEDLVVTALDLNRTEKVRRAWPFLRDRRIDAYNGLLKRFGC
ncbi:MAG: acyltransferase [Candidatus Raymondbacteria bacterium RifOxyA12_full_50_37]|uniref:Acyltransferase n=1 Tax=Candidatus Raymondbacteria bacterium RIFOXYD12_FULL_49_13 TaxID=1817890 RepID=A0A1F7FDE6_UNCRA|nr:MAG: acyltransferase [Candidatus Raymondbacteria bacterium RifOxyA12_full_50_37]OGJ94107.1 MAG: acyltransferase [Candidatus Raymondbacteria bacterium RIFOXYA2_FULL_49_16]OGJ94312.1 MAG: acyltransferase [Candidatus Raymondbacteria bacterium RifOxyB12_full_50_8]OGJ96932.1 MAG: acyltransferase [Candidatus Raymondbacteria bacterium RIFOXYC2_FULL_50_21]OGK04658.1 MAG: acyltransferase [Candidatus Raymondbacteria bacterium RIFOXYD12_FULL_49_13]OGK06196.1 MAG: acyltransferase [Candidatus Raymondbac